MTERAEKAWAGDWRRRIEERLRSLGFDGVAAFVAAFPGEDYFALAGRLGEDVVVAQLQPMHIEEGRKQRRLREVAREVLAREALHHLSRGWGLGEKVDFATASTWADWSHSIVAHGGGDYLEPRLRATWAALKQLPPPQGWRPSNGEDAVIKAAFDAGWPE